MEKTVRLGLLVPAFNSGMEPEFQALIAPGMALHTARIDMQDAPLVSDDDQQAVVDATGRDLPAALGRIMAVRPAAVVLGISILSFWGSRADGIRLREGLERQAGVPVITADDAVLAALRYLPQVRRLAILTPFQPVAERKIAAFLDEAGYRTVAMRSTRASSNFGIASVEETHLIGEIRALAAAGSDAILQLGTNVASARLMEEAERWLGLPCLSINALLFQRALQRIGGAAPV